MADTYTTSLELRIQTVGGNNNSWGGFLNTDLGYIDTAIGGALSVSLASANVTLTAAQNRNPVVVCTGTIPANRELIVKTQTKHFWVHNNTSGAYTVTVKTAAGTGVVVPQGEWRKVYCDGTNVATISGSLASADTVSATLLASDAVTTAKILDANVTLAKLSAAVQASLAPAGAVIPYAGTSEPTGWLLCYGQEINRTTYAALFAVIGTTYGAGDASTTFNLPDLRGRVVAGQDDMGGSSANRLTDADDGLNGDTLGDTGGGETQVLVEANLPAHRHQVFSNANSDNTAITASNSAVKNNATGGDANYEIEANGTTDATVGRTSSVGSDTAFGIVQPTIILNYIIKT